MANLHASYQFPLPKREACCGHARLGARPTSRWTPPWVYRHRGEGKEDGLLRGSECSLQLLFAKEALLSVSVVPLLLNYWCMHASEALTSDAGYHFVVRMIRKDRIQFQKFWPPDGGFTRLASMEVDRGVGQPVPSRLSHFCCWNTLSCHFAIPNAGSL
jgi:hypothetical protein